MKGCYKTKDILKRGTILCMAAMLSFGTVDDRKSVCFNRRTLLIFAGNLFRRGAGYEERTGIAY